MGGYGWLIIIDHPWADIYSLYGHLSPSRWKIESGVEVEKGDLIGYLGDDDENGGSVKNPLVTHLHFGIRVGQRVDYPGFGEWRWMAGWIKPCPQDLSWLQPSVVINNQEIPDGGFQTSSEDFLEKWAVELILGSAYLVGAIGMFVFGTRTDKPYLLLLSVGVLLAAGIYLYMKGWRMSFVLIGVALFLAVTGIFMLARRFTNGKRQKE
jgi:murein DD-endopeptidase MepM/ murein hydrolase activator NlpD